MEAGPVQPSLADQAKVEQPAEASSGAGTTGVDN
jgi:hypothetical protein